MRNKRILTLITLLLCLLLLVGCKARNQAPIITSIPITTVELGETYTYDVNATDPEGDTLAYSLITKPAGMTITSTTGLIKWTPKAEGNFAVAVKVSDGVLYIIQSFPITVSKPPAPPPIVNYAPIITSIPGGTAIIGVVYLYDVNATDPEGDVLTYSLTKKPVGMIINPSTGLISWTPKQIGANAVIVKVSDGKKATTQSFTITVKAVEPDPEIVLTGIEVDPKTMSLFVGEKDFFKVTANYSNGDTKNVTNDCVYVSNDPTIAKVLLTSPSDFQKSVKAVGEGMAEITVCYGDKTDTLIVTVVRTIQEAIDAASAGDTIEVPAGTYPETVTIDKSLTIVGKTGTTPTIDANGSNYGILIEAEISDVSLQNLKVINAKEEGIRWVSVSDSTISGVTVTDSKLGIGLWGPNSSGNTIINTIVSNNSSKGIHVQGTKDCTISDVTVSGNGFSSSTPLHCP
ncbi:DUF1565 domain-containing protein [Candidatus Atribacteria bacterium 1244-E10-H5-B2]|nr:MAG: DUF1565 domain-containing protein [Candidatus Atribacteria bacterium 1244-E10-H5-B2]